MKKDILSRYERHADGRLIIDITANRIEDLYNDFDKRAGFSKKDLDADFADYLAESAREIGEEPFLIRISLTNQPDEAMVDKITGSIKNYFIYMQELQRRTMSQMRRTSAILFIIGMVILTLSILVGQENETWNSVVGDIFAEGLTVAAWVSLWESLAVFLIEWAPNRKKIALYRRIARSEVLCAPAHPAP